MSKRADLRPMLAAAVMLAVLAGAYECTTHSGPAVATTAGPESLVAPGFPTPIALATKLDSQRTAAHELTSKPCPPRLLAYSAGSPAAQRPWVVRRYVGMVGGQPATALLEWQTPDSVTGRFYLHRGGPGYYLSFFRARPGPVLMKVDNERDGENELDQGKWQLTTSTLAGPALAGIWRRAGLSQRLLLRESYTDALRCTFKKRFLTGGASVPTDCGYVPQVQHLLLALPSPAAPLALRAQLAGSPAALRRRVQADHDENDGDATAAYLDEVRLNDFQLFSYQTSYYARTYGGTPDTGTESWLFDLRTGQELTVESQLKPRYERPLRRRLTWHLLHDPTLADARRAGFGDWYDEQGRPTSLVNLPDGNEALTLTGTGLEATYSAHMQILIPYAELRPLVRPGTPLARMLAARGLLS